MAINYRIEQVVRDTRSARANTHSVYVQVFDDAAPSVILARPCIEGGTKAEFKAALKKRLAEIKNRLAPEAAVKTAAEEALAEVVSEEKLK